MLEIRIVSECPSLVRCLLLHVMMKRILRLVFRRPESPEAARQRRLCRMMLSLPPETHYLHVGQGLTTLATLGALFLGLVAWRLGHLRAVAPAFVAVFVVGIFGVACLRMHRCYRHVVAGAFVLAALVGLLAATAYRYGHLERVAALGSLTDSIAGR
jgi:hypothetical protein